MINSTRINLSNFCLWLQKIFYASGVLNRATRFCRHSYGTESNLVSKFATITIKMSEPENGRRRQSGMHRSYQPITPAANKLLQKRWDTNYYQVHRQRVRSCVYFYKCFYKMCVFFAHCHF